MIHVLSSGIYSDRGIEAVLDGPADADVRALLREFVAAYPEAEDWFGDPSRAARVGMDLGLAKDEWTGPAGEFTAFVAWLVLRKGWRTANVRVLWLGDESAGENKVAESRPTRLEDYVQDVAPEMRARFAP